MMYGDIDRENFIPWRGNIIVKPAPLTEEVLFAAIERARRGPTEEEIQWALLQDLIQSHDGAVMWHNYYVQAKPLGWARRVYDLRRLIRSLSDAIEKREAELTREGR